MPSESASAISNRRDGGSAVQLELELADRLAGEARAHLAPIEVEAPLAGLVRQPLVGPLHLGLEDRLERLPREHVEDTLAHRLVGNRREIRPLARQLDLELRPREEPGRTLIPELHGLPLPPSPAPQAQADPRPGEGEVAAVEVDRMEVLDLGVGEGGRAQERVLQHARGVAGGDRKLQLDLAVGVHRGSLPASVAPARADPIADPGFTNSSRDRHTGWSSAGYRPASPQGQKVPMSPP